MMAERFARVLAARYGSSEAISERWWNARAVRVRGMSCVAKLIPYLDGDREWNRQQDKRSAMEAHVYSRLRAWPIRLVETFKSPMGNCIVTTRYENGGWPAYRPSDAQDRAVAGKLLKQIGELHRIGIAHGDLELKNILFRAPASVAVIDFEKSERCRVGGKRQLGDFAKLVAALLSEKSTQGVAFAVIERLIRGGRHVAARHSFLVSVGRAADDAEKWAQTQRGASL